MQIIKCIAFIDKSYYNEHVALPQQSLLSQQIHVCNVTVYNGKCISEGDAEKVHALQLLPRFY
jgi:hypothetical protein